MSFSIQKFSPSKSMSQQTSQCEKLVSWFKIFQLFNCNYLDENVSWLVKLTPPQTLFCNIIELCWIFHNQRYLQAPPLISNTDKHFFSNRFQRVIVLKLQLFDSLKTLSPNFRRINKARLLEIKSDMFRQHAIVQLSAFDIFCSLFF